MPASSSRSRHMDARWTREREGVTYPESRIRERFGSVQDARAHCHVFFPWYNSDHHHARLGPLTSHDVHRGPAEQRVAARAAVLATAYNEVRLLLGVIAYNLGNLLHRLVLPLAIQSWSLTSLQQRLFKTGGRLIRHARCFIFQLAESHLTRRLFGQILGRIERLAWYPT